MDTIILKGESIHIYYTSNDIINDHVRMYFPGEAYQVYSGLSSGISRAIYINETILDLSTLKERLYHECLHMLHTLYNDNIMTELNSNKEEYVVRLITPQVMDIYSMVQQIESSETELLEIINNNKKRLGV